MKRREQWFKDHPGINAVLATWPNDPSRQEMDNVVMRAIAQCDRFDDAFGELPITTEQAKEGNQ